MTMEEKKTTMKNIKQSSLLDEIFVAQILLDLPSMIWKLESGSAFVWGCRKKRSRFTDSSPQKTEIEIEERQTQRKAAKDRGAAAAASPVTPLAFSTSESDEKSTHPFQKSLKKRSREKYIAMIEELTQRRDLLRVEIGNVTNYYNRLIAHNSQLKAIKQEVLNTFHIKGEPKVEISRDINLGVELNPQRSETCPENPPPLAGDQMAEKLLHSIGPMGAQLHSGPGSVNHVGPFGIPDLNISAEEMFGVVLSQPLDVISDRRARFAEARRRRMDIIRIKSMKSACGIKLPRLI